MNIYTNEKFFNGCFFASVKKDNYIFFSHWLINGLFKANLDDGGMTFIGKFSDEKEMFNLHNIAFEHKHEIWFIPSTNGSGISIYDLDRDEIYYLQLPSRRHETKTNKFRSYIKEGDNVWLIPDGYDALLHINCNTREIRLFDQWKRNVEWTTDTSRGFKGALKISNTIYLYPFSGGMVFALDLPSESLEKIAMPAEMDSFYNVICIEHRMIFFAADDMSTMWFFSPKEKRFLKSMISGDVAVDNGLYYVANSIGNNLWIMPFKGNKAICIDILHHTAKQIPLKLENVECFEENARYQSTTTYDDRIIFTSDYLDGYKTMPVISIFPDEKTQYSDLRLNSIVELLKFYICSNASFDSDDLPTACGQRIYNAILTTSVQ